MSKNTIIILLILYSISFFNFTFSQENFNSIFLSEKEEILENSQIINETQIVNAIYIIRNYNGERNLDIEGNTPTFLNNPKKPLKKHFRFISIDINTRKPSNIINSDDYFCIEDKDHHKRIGVTNMQGQIGLFQSEKENEFIIDDNCLWKIFPKIIEEKVDDTINKKIYYYIQNRYNGKYLSFVEGQNNKGTLKCNQDNINKFNNDNYFILHKMYREKLPNESLEIINKEPIDVLIKYIDLSDPDLKREGISQIKKDEDNGEIKYSIRSILNFIPWVRKIFILMPNEKVKYFKEPKEIKDRIVYVKDKDLLGFDSASSPVFQFNLWKMKQFGLSENFILMDDDYFIGKPLEKSNFFYEENGEVFPASVTGDYYELSRKSLETSLKPLLAKINSINSHQPNGFTIMQKSTLLFLYDIFGEDESRLGNPLVEAAFSHNAIPVKQSDIKEIYDYIVNLYPYSNETLLSKTRHIRSLQPQTLFLSYAINKYDRRVKIVTSRFFDLTQFKGKIDTQLFVINTSDKKYAKNYYVNEIKNLEKIFPEKSPYEIGAENIIKENQKVTDQQNQNKKKENQNQKKENENKKEKVENLNKKEKVEIENKKEKVENQNKNENQKKNENKNENKKINENNSNEKNNNEKQEEKKDNNKIENSKDKFYEEMINYLNNNLNEKIQYKEDLIEIKNKLIELSKQYEKTEMQIEELINKLNSQIENNNTTIHENKNKNENSSNYKLLEIIILIIIVAFFIIYLQRKGEFNNKNNNINYTDINSFGSLDNEKELKLINSKLSM